jgi:hypothetical protein
MRARGNDHLNAPSTSTRLERVWPKKDTFLLNPADETARDDERGRSREGERAADAWVKAVTQSDDAHQKWVYLLASESDIMNAAKRTALPASRADIPMSAS